MFEVKSSAEEVNKGAITAMRMVDEEGEIPCTDISAKFVNGEPVSLTAQYVMRDAESWERFMRFMDRYSAASDLGFAGGLAKPSASKPRSQGV
jgi:photosystem II protein